MSVLAELVGKTDTERAVIKATEHERLAPKRTHDLGRYSLEIRSCVRNRGRVEVELRAWLDGNPVGFGQDGSAEIERHVVHNPPILVPDPAGPISRLYTFDDPNIPDVTEFFREDPAAALVDILAHAVRIVGKPGGAIQAGKVAQTSDTLFPNAGSTTAPLDSAFNREPSSESFSVIRAGAGTLINVSGGATVAHLLASTTTDEYASMVRVGFGFDPSAFTGATLNSATFSAYGHVSVGPFSDLGAVGLVVGSFTPGVDTGWTASLYATANWGTTGFATEISTSAWAVNAYNDYALNASGISYAQGFITSGDIIYLGLRTAWDRDNDSGGPTWASGVRSGGALYLADDAGTTRDPKLVVDYTLGTTITVPQGTLALSTVAAGLGVKLGVPLSNLLLTTFAPQRSTDVLLTPGAANLLLSTAAPTLGVGVRPGQANLLLSSAAASLHSDMSVPQGNLSLSTTAPAVTITTPGALILSPGQANLLLSPTAASLHSDLVVPQGNLVLDGKTPSLDAGLSVPQANLSLSTTASSLGVGMGVPQGNLLFSTFAPTLIAPIIRNPDQANLRLTTVAPGITLTGVEEVTTGQGNLGPSLPYKRKRDYRTEYRDELRRELVEQFEALRKAKPSKEVIEPILEEVREYLRDEKGRFISPKGRRAEQRGELPPTSAMDLDRLMGSMDSIESLIGALEKAQVRQKDEELLVMMMLAA